jgi:hypothetical protein
LTHERNQIVTATHPLQQVLLHLHAGRWNAAHDLVQHDGSMLGAWLHGILHLQEGDLEDAENWYDRAARHFRSRGTLAEEIAAFEAALAASSAPAVAPPISTPPPHI